MKKNKSKSKNHSASKKLRKELELRLATAISEIVNQFGKAKKPEKVIEKFAKQLSKKISIAPAEDSIASFIKEEQVAPLVIKEKAVKPVAVKVSASKAKKEVSE
ncbi:hypothetical protein [Pedobacter sp. Leaf194]|uniref:hypothetical protein n=1 Tax=Pedobacter sp. Leaf194 TaxID=1736297 RepID=UPI000703A51A|nr:hypothetical protein [Pedobacter sp. Leaf194]KQS35944.1 hypothetical protein ASG14_10865 [Pedobacter sp. Leaf194]